MASSSTKSNSHDYSNKYNKQQKTGNLATDQAKIKVKDQETTSRKNDKRSLKDPRNWDLIVDDIDTYKKNSVEIPSDIKHEISLISDWRKRLYCIARIDPSWLRNELAFITRWSKTTPTVEFPKPWRISSAPYALLHTTGAIKQAYHPVKILLYCCRLVTILIQKINGQFKPNDYKITILLELLLAMIALITSELQNLLMLTSLARSSLAVRPLTIAEEFVVQTGYHWPQFHIDKVEEMINKSTGEETISIQSVVSAYLKNNKPEASFKKFSMFQGYTEQSSTTPLKDKIYLSRHNKTPSRPPTFIKVERLTLIRNTLPFLSSDRQKLSESFLTLLSSYKVEDSYVPPNKSRSQLPELVPPVEKPDELMSFSEARAAVKIKTQMLYRPYLESIREPLPTQDILTAQLNTSSRDRWGPNNRLFEMYLKILMSKKNRTSLAFNFDTEHEESTLLKIFCSLLKQAIGNYKKSSSNQKESTTNEEPGSKVVKPQQIPQTNNITTVSHQYAALNPVYGAFPASTQPISVRPDLRTQVILHLPDNQHNSMQMQNNQQGYLSNIPCNSWNYMDHCVKSNNMNQYKSYSSHNYPNLESLELLDQPVSTQYEHNPMYSNGQYRANQQYNSEQFIDMQLQNKYPNASVDINNYQTYSLYPVLHAGKSSAP